VVTALLRRSRSPQAAERGPGRQGGGRRAAIAKRKAALEGAWVTARNLESPAPVEQLAGSWPRFPLPKMRVKRASDGCLEESRASNGVVSALGMERQHSEYFDDQKTPHPPLLLLIFSWGHAGAMYPCFYCPKPTRNNRHPQTPPPPDTMTVDAVPGNALSMGGHSGSGSHLTLIHTLAWQRHYYSFAEPGLGPPRHPLAPLNRHMEASDPHPTAPSLPALSAAQPSHPAKDLMAASGRPGGGASGGAVAGRDGLAVPRLVPLKRAHAGLLPSH